MELDIASLIGTILENSALAGLAVFAIWMLNRVWKDRLDAEKRHGAQIKCLYEQTLKALQDNTRAVTTLTDKLDR